VGISGSHVRRPSRLRVTSAARHPGVRTRSQSPAETRTFLDAVDVHPKTLDLVVQGLHGDAEQRSCCLDVAQLAAQCILDDQSFDVLELARRRDARAAKAGFVDRLAVDTPNTKPSATLRSSRISRPCISQQNRRRLLVKDGRVALEPPGSFGEPWRRSDPGSGPQFARHLCARLSRGAAQRENTPAELSGISDGRRDASPTPLTRSSPCREGFSEAARAPTRSDVGVHRLLSIGKNLQAPVLHQLPPISRTNLIPKPASRRWQGPQLAPAASVR